MSTSTFLDEDDLELEEVAANDVVEDEVVLTREITTPLSTRRRVEDLLEQKRLERELLEFDYREDFRSHRDCEEE